jgi:hypothetical protein
MRDQVFEKRARFTGAPVGETEGTGLNLKSTQAANRHAARGAEVKLAALLVERNRQSSDRLHSGRPTNAGVLLDGAESPD